MAGLLLYKQKQKQLKLLLSFLVALFIYGLLNMLMYYKLRILSYYGVDYYISFLINIAFALANYFWFLKICRLSQNRKKQKEKILFFICMAYVFLSVLDSLLFTNEILQILNQAGNTIATLMECVLFFLLLLFSIGIFRKSKSWYDRYGSVLLLLYLCYITVKDIWSSLFSGHIIVFPLSCSFAALFCFLINLMTAVYLLHEFKAFIESVNCQKLQIETLELTLEEVREQYQISEREMDVLLLIYQGKNNTEIAESLFISTNTVKKHINSIFRKMKASSKAALISKIRLKMTDGTQG